MRIAFVTLASIVAVNSCATMNEPEPTAPHSASLATERWTGETTVGAIVAASPATARIFELIGIDYCCGGQTPLSEAAAENGIDEEQLLRALSVVGPGSTPDTSRNWQDASLAELIDHIVDTHHVWLRRELPGLGETAATVHRVHGAEHPELSEVVLTLHAISAAVIPHLRVEEEHTFPAISALESGKRPDDARRLLQDMKDDHDELGEALHKLRELTMGYSVPPGACAKYTELMNGLAALERDMHVHVHLENNILLPRALALLEE